MNDLDLTELRNEALRKIGRNIVNFQRMEGALKAILSLSKMSGVASELEAARRKRIDAIDKQTMGLLVMNFMDSVHGDGPSRDKEPVPLTEPWLSFSFRIGSDKESTRAQKKALMLVVAERNALIHRRLLTFDPSSAESCRALIAHLDEQNERLTPHYQYVMSVGATMHSAFQEVAGLVKSGALSSALGKAVSNTN